MGDLYPKYSLPCSQTGCWLFSDVGLTVAHEGTIGVFGSLGCSEVSWPTKHGAHSAQLLHLQKKAIEAQRGRVSFPVLNSSLELETALVSLISSQMPCWPPCCFWKANKTAFLVASNRRPVLVTEILWLGSIKSVQWSFMKYLPDSWYQSVFWGPRKYRSSMGLSCKSFITCGGSLLLILRKMKLRGREVDKKVVWVLERERGCFPMRSWGGLSGEVLKLFLREWSGFWGQEPESGKHFMLGAWGISWLLETNINRDLSSYQKS